jgi:hypothetical protein
MKHRIEVNGVCGVCLRHFCLLAGANDPCLHRCTYPVAGLAELSATATYKTVAAHSKVGHT